MTLTRLQTEFIALFVMDGEYSLHSTCASLGVRPSEAHLWFRDKGFQKALRTYEHAQLRAMGYGPLRAVREMLALAHSNIGDVQAIEGDLMSLPWHVRAAIKKIEFSIAQRLDGTLYTYPKKIEMHDKFGPLKQVAEWAGVGEAPEVKEVHETGDDSGPRRITGLTVRPPLTSDDRDVEDLLK